MSQTRTNCGPCLARPDGVKIHSCLDRGKRNFYSTPILLAALVGAYWQMRARPGYWLHTLIVFGLIAWAAGAEDRSNDHDTSSDKKTGESMAEKLLASTAKPDAEPASELEPAHQESASAAATTTPTTSGDAGTSTALEGDQMTETATATETATSAAAAAAEPTKKSPLDCLRDSYCLNGGTCIINELGQMSCICPPEFYGARCQTFDICKSLIVAGHTGEQICQLIGRTCLRSDKFFRCDCAEDEYFVFRAPEQQPKQQQQQPAGSNDETTVGGGGDPAAGTVSGEPASATFGYDRLATTQGADQPSPKRERHLAECRKVDKCLGVRCRQLSERCVAGRCECNRQLGYLRDPTDRLCKLLDPCQMGPGGRSPCGEQAQCVATYDRELYRCVCPIGFRAVQVSAQRNSTQCAPLSDLLCEVPLLNKCQQVCKIDLLSNSYRCSCLAGYRPGSRPGIDDHLCFFDELGAGASEAPDEDAQERLDGGAWRSSSDSGSVYRPYVPSDGPAGERAHWRLLKEAGLGAGFAYSPSRPDYRPLAEAETGRMSAPGQQRRWPPGQLVIRREQAQDGRLARPAGESAAGHSPSADPAAGSSAAASDQAGYYGAELAAIDMAQLSAQDRCNMYCEENKICVLEPGSSDSYRCACERQGYVSIGDRCLDWCSAAEFSHNIQFALEKVCLSGLCRASRRDELQQRKRRHGGWLRNSNQQQQGRPAGERGEPADEPAELEALLGQSAWRPSFECDCSSSALLERDPRTGLCRLDFDQILRPCLPGHEGHQDCVVNKHSYCTVLHKSSQMFLRDLLAEQLLAEVATGSQSAAAAAAASSSSSRNGRQATGFAGPAGPQSASAAKKLQASLLKAKSDKLYRCVCSPEKKFLVDKPRKKARCIDECDLLNVECGRFNRMCRAATIDSDDFGRGSLVRVDRDGAIRMNQFKRTGCECLPGFNVGPSESLDFTLDDNYPAGSQGPLVADALVPLPLPVAPALLQQQQQQQQQQSGELPVGAGAVQPGDLGHLRTRYMNINSRCLLDYDVVEFHATFKAPADFEPAWIELANQPASASKRPPVVPAAPDLGQQQQTGDGQPLPRSMPAGASWQQADSEHQDAGPLQMPPFMRADINQLHKLAVLVAQCDPALAPLSLDFYRACTRYRYWVVQKLRQHFVDWRRVLTRQLKETFDLMEGNIRLRVNKCQANVRRIETVNPEVAGNGSPSDATLMPTRTPTQPPAPSMDSGDKKATTIDSKRSAGQPEGVQTSQFDPYDQFALVNADLYCELTIHSSSDDSSSSAAGQPTNSSASASSSQQLLRRKVLLEKQLPRFIFEKPALLMEPDHSYYLMAPGALIHRDSFDQLARHRKLFSPCESDYAYCDKQTRCEMVDTVNFTCTCEYGYTPIGSRDIYFGDSRKEVCEDIDECLFDVCKENGLENKSICVNEIGDYRCQCIRHHVGDNKRYCNHICNVISCKYGDCRIPDEHHAFCECYEGYREADCSVQDPSVALRKANMIICGSIFASVLMLAITLAISLNSKLKKTKKELKRLEAAHQAAQLFELPGQQTPFGHRARMSRISAGS